MKKLLYLVMTLAALFVLPAVGAVAEKVLTIGVDQEVVGLDPHIATAFSSHRRIDLLYNRLVRLDDNLAIVPDLAESWDIPNNLTYVFHLRHGVKFHNGREMTSDDVKYSLERV
ncbi:MAG TPA: ABC transporter substrate-binding protein, partial [Spirochaetia bacterium]